MDIKDTENKDIFHVVKGGKIEHSTQWLEDNANRVIVAEDEWGIRITDDGVAVCMSDVTMRMARGPRNYIYINDIVGTWIECSREEADLLLLKVEDYRGKKFYSWS